MGWWWRKRNKKLILARGATLVEELIECCDGKSNPIKFFSADEIRKATDNFSESNLLSRTPTDDYIWYVTLWYSGKNENHRKILVSQKYFYEKQNIFRDIAVSTMVSGHKNFMQLVGCCLESKYPVMVYGDVKKHDRLDRSAQTWKRRMKIAEDIATALAYLHTAFPRPFLYRRMSIGNILVDEDGDAKLIDFSYCVSIPEGETYVQVSPVGFDDFLTKFHSVVSEKTDVFDFGFFMQSLLIGTKRYWEIWTEAREKGYRESNVDDDSHQFWLSKFGREERRMDEIADQQMIEKMGEISEEELSQMKAFLMLSLRCVGFNGEFPTMVEVAKELKKIQTSLITDDSSSPSEVKLAN